MKRFSMLAALMLLAQAGSGCSRDGKAPVGAPAAGQGSPSSQGQPASAPEAAEGGYILTKEKLDGYLKYQQSLGEVYQGMFRELEKAPVAGSAQARQASNNLAMRMLETKARAEEKARADANLSERDVREIDAMVMAVINKRSMARSFDPSAAVKQWETMKDSLPASQRADLDRSISEMKSQQESAQKLTEERKQFGDANIDLILSREDELARIYNANLSLLTGHH